jgi:hypothetical protein
MTNLKRALTAIVAVALAAFAAFLAARFSVFVWHEWHGSTGLRWPATIGLGCALATAGVVWAIIVMVQP